MSILESIFGATCIHIPLKYRCLMKRNDQIKHVSLMAFQDMMEMRPPFTFEPIVAPY